MPLLRRGRPDRPIEDQQPRSNLDRNEPPGQKWRIFRQRLYESQLFSRKFHTTLNFQDLAPEGLL